MPELDDFCAAASVTALAVLAPSPLPGRPRHRLHAAGMNALKGLGVFSAVAKDGLPISTAVAVGVRPRAGTDVAALPDPLPLSVVLADHRAGANSLFIYPWCS